MLSKTAIYLIIADLKMFVRDRRAIMWTLFFPLVIMSIFGIVDFGRTGNTNLGLVIPEELSEQMKPFVDGLASNSKMTVTQGDIDTELTALQEDERDLILEFTISDEVSVEESIEEEASAETTPTEFISPEDIPAGQLIADINAPIQPEPQTIEVQAYLNEANAQTAQISLLAIKQSLSEISFETYQIQPLFSVSEELVNVHHLTATDFILPGIIGMAIMSAGLFGVVGGIVRYRERGVLKRLFATPLKRGDFLFSQVVTRLVVNMMQISVFFVYPKIANWMIAQYKDIPLQDAQFYYTVVGNPLMMLGVAVLGALLFICIGFAFSGFAKTIEQAMPMVNLISMPMMMLSGVFFPREAFPNILQKASEFLPLTFLVDALREIMNNGVGVYDIRLELAGLAVWALITFLAAVKMYRWE